MKKNYILDTTCVDTFCNKREFAFTLAEVLITLGIIGVVAAMTLPVLIQKYQKQVLYTQFRKAASQLEQAYKMYQVDHGCIGNLRNCKDFFYAEDIIPYFKVAQIINNDNFEDVCKNAFDKDDDYIGCFNNYDDNVFAFITTDGTLYNLSADQGVGTGSIVDVNGPNKGPNKYGRDLFVFYGYAMNYENIVWGGAEYKFGSDNENCTPCNSNNECGHGCAAKLLSDGKMNY